MYLAMDINNYNIYAATELVNAATWGIRAVELNNTAIENVDVEGAGAETEVYDLTGRRVNDAVLKGVYIIDGKKVVT